MVKVTVTVDSGGIKVHPDPVKLRKGEKNVLIRWLIGTRGWDFTDDGIVIHRNRNQFIAPANENGKVFHWHSRNTNKKRYEYTVSVTNGKTTASRDPGIKNGGH